MQEIGGPFMAKVKDGKVKQTITSLDVSDLSVRGSRMACVMHQYLRDGNR